MKLMQMVSSQEKVHYVLAIAAGGIPVSLLSDALHYQSATKLAFKLETNLLNNAFPTSSFSQITCNPFCIWFTFAIGEILCLETAIYVIIFVL